MNRAALVARYLELQREAESMGIRGSAHVTQYTGGDEIVRLGRLLRARVDEWKARIVEHERLLSK